MKDRRHPSGSGFSLVEVLLVVLLLAIALSPMLQAFHPALRLAEATHANAVLANQAQGTLARIVALEFDTLEANQGNPVNLAALFGASSEADKEAFLFKGQTYVPTVVITNAGGEVGGLIEVSVAVDSVRLKTLKARY